MRRAYGAVVAKALRRRLTELDTADRVDELPGASGHWARLRADRLGLWSGRLSANWRVVVQPVGDGDAVIVVEIVDYH
ncbi:MAG: type II toxin-antitoxin system RelE/ParE family toxin [Propionibacteriaceae bacterium]|jgi:proteic killer suppression protein|nr:type II toxin-antitoxin system RelE/ParE family toxin [Propionibacteriaceae bacterium]